MITVIILVFVLYAVWLCLPYIRRYMQRKAAERMAKILRQAMGMPEENPDQRQKRRTKKRPAEQWQKAQADMRDSRYGYAGSRKIPQEYAEDVEYTEFKEYSHAETDADGVRYEVEQQVTDVEWEEIREKKRKG